MYIGESDAYFGSNAKTEFLAKYRTMAVQRDILQVKSLATKSGKIEISRSNDSNLEACTIFSLLITSNDTLLHFLISISYSGCQCLHHTLIILAT